MTIYMRLVLVPIKGYLLTQTLSALHKNLCSITNFWGLNFCKTSSAILQKPLKSTRRREDYKRTAWRCDICLWFENSSSFGFALKTLQFNPTSYWSLRIFIEPRNLFDFEIIVDSWLVITVEGRERHTIAQWPSKVVENKRAIASHMEFMIFQTTDQ